MNSKLCLIFLGALLAMAVLSAAENSAENNVSEEVSSSRLAREANASKNRKKLKKKSRKASKKMNKSKRKSRKSSKKMNKPKSKSRKASKKEEKSINKKRNGSKKKKFKRKNQKENKKKMSRKSRKNKNANKNNRMNKNKEVKNTFNAPVSTGLKQKASSTQSDRNILARNVILCNETELNTTISTLLECKTNIETACAEPDYDKSQLGSCISCAFQVGPIIAECIFDINPLDNPKETLSCIKDTILGEGLDKCLPCVCYLIGKVNESFGKKCCQLSGGCEGDGAFGEDENFAELGTLGPGPEDKCTPIVDDFDETVTKCSELAEVAVAEACDCWESPNLANLTSHLRDCQLKPSEKNVTNAFKKCKTAISTCNKAMIDSFPLQVACSKTNDDLVKEAETIANNIVALKGVKSAIEKFAGRRAGGVSTCTEFLSLINLIVQLSPESTEIIPIAKVVVESDVTCDDEQKVALAGYFTAIDKNIEDAEAAYQAVQDAIKTQTGSTAAINTTPLIHVTTNSARMMRKRYYNRSNLKI